MVEWLHGCGNDPTIGLSNTFSAVTLEEMLRGRGALACDRMRVRK
jgi:hypothetical protein